MRHWILLACAFVGTAGWGQSVKTIVFTNGKPVLGLPVPGERAKAHCAVDGITYFEGLADQDAGAAANLYGVSTDGEVKSLRRKLPEGFSEVRVLDFFAGEHEAVSLLEAERRDDNSRRVTETSYFLSIADHDGDFSKLISMDVKFRPLKVGMFGSGEVLVLGWDTGNLLPVLVAMKEDGSVRRFVDLDERGLERDGRGAGTITTEDRETVLKDLQGAAFVSYGAELLVTYPGTGRGIRVLSGTGLSRTIPMLLPGGYVLRDVLVSEGRGLLVLRVKPALASDEKKRAPDSDVRMFEVNATRGDLIRELMFRRPRMTEVTCATGYSLTAIFLEPVARPEATKAVDEPMQLVVSKVPRNGR